MKGKKLKARTEIFEAAIAELLKEYRRDAEAEVTEIRFQSLHASVTNSDGIRVFPAYEVKVSICFP